MGTLPLPSADECAVRPCVTLSYRPTRHGSLAPEGDRAMSEMKASTDADPAMLVTVNTPKS
jgi:hypothetical protein